jgi:SAM-dependent methyltransferase
MTQDGDGRPPAASVPAPTAADFDRAFSAPPSPGIRRVWELADTGLPAEVEPYSFVSADMLRYVGQALDLSPGHTLVDLGCGRGGPGLWLAREARAWLVGVDFSAAGVAQAAQRAALFGLTGRVRFAVGDLADTGLLQASADAAVSVDAFHFAADPAAAAREVRRILRPGRPLVLTTWLPEVAGDVRLLVRLRTDWPAVLGGAGFTRIQAETRPGWHDVRARVYRTALDLGDPADDRMLADLQGEARRHLPLTDLIRRVILTAVA